MLWNVGGCNARRPCPGYQLNNPLQNDITTTHFPLAQGSTHVHASAMLVGLSPSEHVSQLAWPALLWYINGPTNVQEEHAA